MPKTKHALRLLSRRFPAPEKVQQILDQFGSQPDRSVAIAGAALTENFLERAIEKKLDLQEPALMGQLFLNRGPLSDFSSKILIAQAIGVLTKGMAEEYGRIRNIRNAFAHSSEDISFDTEEVAAELDTSILMGLLEGSKDFIEGKVVHKPNPERLKKYQATKKSKFIFLLKAACYVVEGKDGPM